MRYHWCFFVSQTENSQQGWSNSRVRYWIGQSQTYYDSHSQRTCGILIRSKLVQSSTSYLVLVFAHTRPQPNCAAQLLNCGAARYSNFIKFVRSISTAHLRFACSISTAHLRNRNLSYFEIRPTLRLIMKYPWWGKFAKAHGLGIRNRRCFINPNRFLGW